MMTRTFSLATTSLGATPSTSPGVTQTTAPLKQAAETVSSSAGSLGEQFHRIWPLALIAFLIMLAGVGVVRVGRRYIRRALRLRYNEAFASVTARILGWLFLLVVLLVALAITFPSINMISVLSGLGFISVAVGFALKDILENSFSGWLLLYRESFVVGDQIEVADQFGDVEAVNVRETVIRRRDGQRILIPNRDVYKSTIRVQTAHPLRRFDFFLEFDYIVDHHSVITTLVNAIGEVHGVVADPAPKGRIDDTTSEVVLVKLMGWTKSEQGAFNDCRNRVIQHVINTMIEHDIPLPDDVQHLDAITEESTDKFTM